MKKITIFLMAVLIIISILPSCGKENSAEIPVDSSAVTEETETEAEKEPVVVPPSASQIKENIQNIAELTTVKCKVHLNGSGTKTVKSVIDIFGLGWLSKDYLVIFGYDAEYEVGVTIESVEVDSTAQKVTVALSEPKLTKCDILKGTEQEKEYPMIVYEGEENKEKIIQEKKQATLSERNEIRNNSEEKLRERLETEKPNFELAKQTAKELIRCYIQSVSDYEVEFP